MFSLSFFLFISQTNKSIKLKLCVMLYECDRGGLGVFEQRNFNEKSLTNWLGTGIDHVRFTYFQAENFTFEVREAPAWIAWAPLTFYLP